MVERTMEYLYDKSNFNSVYNAPFNIAPQPVVYVPLISWPGYTPAPDRPLSPLFRRCASPPPREPLFPKPGPKFSFDHYKMTESALDYNAGISPPARALSPTSADILHRHSLYSPRSSSSSETRSLSKLREANDELYQSLDLAERVARASTSPHYHIHHHPVSQLPSQRHHHRSRSTYDDFEVSPKPHKARVTYRVHFPESDRSPSQRTFRRPSTPSSSSSSDASSRHEPIIVDLYPTRDEGRRRHADDRNPWIVQGTSIHRDSHSDVSTPRSPRMSKGLYYGDRLISSSRRAVRDKDLRPSSTRPRTSPARHQKPHGSSSSRVTTSRSPKHFRPIEKPEPDVRTRVRTALDETQSEPTSHRRPLSHRPEIRTSDPRYQRRIANAESKVKSAWEPTVTGLSAAAAKRSKSPTTTVEKDAPVSIRRSSGNDVIAKPIFESTPRDQSVADKENENVDDLFGNKSHVSDPPERKETPRTPTPPVEPPRKPSTELPKSPPKTPDTSVKDNAPTTDHDQPPTAKSDSEDDKIKTHDTQPSPIVPNPKTPSPEPDANDQEVASTFNFNGWLNHASKEINDASKPRAVTPPAPKTKSPPRRKVQPPTPPRDDLDESLYNPPFGPKKTNPEPEPAPSPPPASDTADVDDFFS